MIEHGSPEPTVTELVVLQDLAADLARFSTEERRFAFLARCDLARPRLFPGDVWRAFDRVKARVAQGEDALAATLAETLLAATEAFRLHEVECGTCAASVDEERGVAPYEDHCREGRRLYDVWQDLDEKRGRSS